MQLAIIRPSQYRCRLQNESRDPKIKLCAYMIDIKIITTGGTIDKIYFDAKSEFQVGAPQIGEVLKEANVTPGFEITSLCARTVWT